LADELAEATPESKVGLLSALGNAGQPQFEQSIADELSAPEVNVRARAAYALRHIHTATAKSALLKAIASDAQPVLRMALTTLKAFDIGPADVEQLSKAVTTGQIGAATGDLVVDLLAKTVGGVPEKRAALLAILQADDVLRGTKARARVILSELTD
jgi:hypothetical protein